MANFTPWKKYMLMLVDEMIMAHGLSDPFLDVGCGSGDVAVYFAKKGWGGKAIDLSDAAIARAKLAITSYKDNVSIEQTDISNIAGVFNTVFIFDVLEHIPDDQTFIQEIKKKMNPAGALVLSVPIKSEEWRWDDDFYGHIRRYELDHLIHLLKTVRLEIIESWDCTFPFFWIMRRIYTKLFPKKNVCRTDKTILTMQSTSQSAWDQSSILTKIVEQFVWWRPLFFIQHKFRKAHFGCERLILAKSIESLNSTSKASR